MIVDAPGCDDDWYANLLWIDRRKCLLLTHAGTLFPVFAAGVRKRDLQPPGPSIAAHAEAALADSTSARREIASWRTASSSLARRALLVPTFASSAASCAVRTGQVPRSPGTCRGAGSPPAGRTAGGRRPGVLDSIAKNRHMPGLSGALGVGRGYQVI